MINLYFNSKLLAVFFPYFFFTYTYFQIILPYMLL